MAGVKYRECPECHVSSAYPVNKVTCCLRKGKNQSTRETVILSAEEIQELVRQEVERAVQADREARVQPADFFADGATILISDIHIPLHHVKATAAVINFLHANAGTGYLRRLVLAGDIFDATNLSRHPKQSREDGHPFDFGDELYAGKHLISDMVEAIDDECWYFPGNHEQRLWRKLAEGGNGGIPGDPLTIENLLAHFEYPEKLQTYSERKLKIGNGDEGSVYIIHGEKYNKHRASGLLEENLYQSTIQGHTHRPATYWHAGRFGMVNGYLHDPTRQQYMPDPSWTLGFSILEHWDNGRKANPYFVRITNDGTFSFAGRTYRG